MNESTAGGVGCFTVIFLILLILKLTHNIDASWWLVTLPLWGPWALLLIFIALAAAVSD
jgi:hypothetical protein